ncbi:hypothetical protein ACRW0U_27925, partial [Escherichia coli]
MPELTDSSADEEINITLNRSTLEMLRNLSKEITESENKQLRRAENRQAKLNGEKPKYPRKKNAKKAGVNRPGFPGECFICELRLPDHRFRWKHNKLFLLL